MNMSENDDLSRLVRAATAAIGWYEGKLTPLNSGQAARDVAAAVLQTLSELMDDSGWEDGNDWPDPLGLERLAAEIQGDTAEHGDQLAGEAS